MMLVTLWNGVMVVALFLWLDFLCVLQDMVVIYHGRLGRNSALPGLSRTMMSSSRFRCRYKQEPGWVGIWGELWIGFSCFRRTLGNELFGLFVDAKKRVESDLGGFVYYHNHSEYIGMYLPMISYPPENHVKFHSRRARPPQCILRRLIHYSHTGTS